MRNAEVIRQWKILKTIEKGRFTSSAKLAAEYGVTERTIRRDVEALQEAGFPLYDDRADGKKVWRLVEGYQQKLAQGFTLSELAALYFSRNMLSFLGGAPFGQDLESAFAKIREALPAKSLPFLSRIQELFVARPDPWKDYSEKQDVIAALIDAILHQRQARIAYYSFNSRRTKSYGIDPYRLVYYRGGLYLYARAHEYDEVRTFAVERVQQVEVHEVGFEIPADFSPSEYARLRFRHHRGQAADDRARVRGGDRGLRARAQLAREPGARRGARRLGPAHARGRAELRPQVLDQGLPAAREGGAPGVAARRDRARARGGARHLPAALGGRPLE
jgi:predicted DNA-binding transcriptional regulator YafY